MLEIIFGRAGTGKTRYCFNKIKESLQSALGGSNHILLLPEHMTYSVERRLVSEMVAQSFSFMGCHVYGFRRFAQQILSETGGGLEPGITELGRQLMLKQLLDKKERELSYFARAAKKRGFSKSLAEIIDEFKSYNISPDKLIEAAENTSDAWLQSKLRDLGLLYGDFAASIQGRYRDRGDLLNKLIEKLPESKLVRQSDAWLDGFLFFNPQEQLIVSKLLELCPNVHVTLTLATDENGSLNNQRENYLKTGIFSRSYRTLQILQRLANEQRTEIKYHSGFSVPYRYRNPSLVAIEAKLACSHSVNANIDIDENTIIDANTDKAMNEKAQNEITKNEKSKKYHDAGKVKSGKNFKIRIIEAANIRLEAELAAGDIIRQVRENNCRWNDVGIIVRDSSYSKILPLVLGDYGIPYYMDSKRSCANHPVAELLRSALKIVNNNWRYDDVFRCLKTGFFSGHKCASDTFRPVNEEDIDILENYVLEFGIKGKSWQLHYNEQGKEVGWKYVHSYSLEDDRIHPDEQQRLLTVNRIRQQVSAPLLKLENKLKGSQPSASHTALKITTALYDFLKEIGVPETLKELWENADAAGRLAEAKEHQQVWKDIMSLFDQMVDVGGDEAITLKEYEAILGEGLDALQVSLIPPGVDYVTISSFDQNAMDNIPFIYVLGVNEGVMPRRSKENDLLSDDERNKLVKIIGVELPAVGSDSSFNERYLLYRGFTQSRDYLWLSYSLADYAGNAMNPSSLVNTIKNALSSDDFEFISVPLEVVAQEDERIDELKTAQGRQSMTELASALRGCREGGQLSKLWQGVYDWSREQPELLPYLNEVKQGIFADFSATRLPKEIAVALYTNKKHALKGSVTRIESYNKCPFQFFSRYGLNLQSRLLYRFQSLDLGNLIHAVLEKYGIEHLSADATEAEKKEAIAHKWDVFEPERCDKLVDQLAKKLQNEILLNTERNQARLARIKHTVRFTVERLCAFAASSKYVQSHAELAFGDREKGQIVPVFPLDAEVSLELTGKIDRIDEMEDRFLIIDYKTGQAGINLLEVYTGQKLQLLTYLFVAQELLGGKLPGAMLYWFAKQALITANDNHLTDAEIQIEVNKKLRVDGWVQSNGTVSEAVEDIQNILDVDQFGQFTGITVSSDKKEKGRKPNRIQYIEYKVKTGKNKLQSDEDFNLLMEYTKAMLENSSRRIISGNVDIRPYKKGNKTPCSFCDYKGFCCFDESLPEFSCQPEIKLSDEELKYCIQHKLTPDHLSNERKDMKNQAKGLPEGSNGKQETEVKNND